MPGTERLYLHHWRFDSIVGETLGTTEATGFARQREDAEQFSQRLAEQAGFRIRPNPIGYTESAPEYPTVFQLDAELVSQKRRAGRSERK